MLVQRIPEYRGAACDVTWDQALFSFRFENYIPAGKAVAVRENVWEPLKLGLISGYWWWALNVQII